MTPRRPRLRYPLLLPLILAFGLGVLTMDIAQEQRQRTHCQPEARA